MKEQRDVELKHLNTLGLPCVAKQLITLDKPDELPAVFEREGISPNTCLILGGGSNLVLPEYLDMTVLHFAFNAIHVRDINDNQVEVEAEAGVVWDHLVAYAVARELRGIENLSLIPGSVGAAPVQNIGAYGVEISDCLVSVKVLDTQLSEIKELDRGECLLSYRDSIFKQEKGRYCILSVKLLLSRDKDFSLAYGELASLKEQHETITLSMVRDKVISVRQAKLPSPDKLPNAGSFFKNPVVSIGLLSRLQQEFPAIVNYPVGEQKAKLAAAWLIDQAGWKGVRREHVGVHDKQALVLLNHQGARQSDILSLASDIQESVHIKFGVSLEIEPIVL
jgi:UDP-N-acetylmuramate dehydrogenase